MHSVSVGRYPTIVSDESAAEVRQEIRRKELEGCPARQIMVEGPLPWQEIVEVLDNLQAKNDDYAKVLDQLRALESLESH
jgi:hypothetical protein